MNYLVMCPKCAGEWRGLYVRQWAENTLHKTLSPCCKSPVKIIKSTSMVGIFRTKSLDTKSGKPDAVILMKNRYEGLTLPGGLWAMGELLHFDESGDASFKEENWLPLTLNDYKQLLDAII